LNNFFIHYGYTDLAGIITDMEQTLVLLKPDAVQRAIAGEIISRFERAGLKIVGMKMVAPDESHYHHHYETISKLVSRRGDYAHMTMDRANERNSGLANLIHASGNSSEAKEEVAHWFSDQELFDYKTVHENLTQ
jgi:nucleoside-diphosphate kinase